MADPDYDQDQARLRAQQEGDSDEEFQAEIPKLPEINPEIYKDVEPLLFRGFLHVSGEINDVRFIFKSLNHHEFSMLSLMNPKDEMNHKNLQRFYAMFLAYGVMMIGQDNILLDRDRWIPRLVEVFTNMEEGPKIKVIRYLSEINRRATQATVLTEAFSMDTFSRLRWAQLKGSDLTSTSVTGVLGTNSLGMNWAQLTWRAINHYADLKEQAEREWENAKFIASSMAGKGMVRIHNQDKRRREQEAKDQIERRDKIIRFALLGESMDTKGSQLGPIKVARTVEELNRQLQHDLRGEKDWHDTVVDAHEAQVREQSRQRMEQLQQMQRTYEETYGTQSLVGSSTRLEGLTAEEARFQIERKRQLVAQKLSSQQVPPELLDPKYAEFADKWANVRPRSDQDPQKIQLVPTVNRAPGSPFNLKK